MVFGFQFTRKNFLPKLAIVVFFLVIFIFLIFSLNFETFGRSKNWGFEEGEVSGLWQYQKDYQAYYPIKIGYEVPPAITARSVMVVDPDSHLTLLAKNADLKLPPASLTKLATALVAVQNCSWNQVIQISPVKTTGTVAGLVPGDLMTVEELLYALLLPSGNDAAQVLSQNCSSGEQFVNSMNSLARKLGMSNTHFVNPTGLDHYDQYSTANDLVKLTITFMKDVRLAAVVSSREVTFDDTNNQREYHFTNLNKLLSTTPGVVGVKTGTTATGEENLITMVNRNNRRIIVVILGSTSRFDDSQKIIEWVYNNFDWVSL